MFRPGKAESRASLPWELRADAKRQRRPQVHVQHWRQARAKNIAVQFSHAAFMPIDVYFYLLVIYKRLKIT
jgi:hypothetical protein